MKWEYTPILRGIFKLSTHKFFHCSLLLLLLHQLTVGNIEFSILLAQISPQSTTLNLFMFVVINYEENQLNPLARTFPEASSDGLYVARCTEVIGLIFAAPLPFPSPGEEDECSGPGRRQFPHCASSSCS